MLADLKVKAKLADLGAVVFRGRPLTSESLSPKKPRNGPRW